MIKWLDFGNNLMRDNWVGATEIYLYNKLVLEAGSASEPYMPLPLSFLLFVFLLPLYFEAYFSTITISISTKLALSNLQQSTQTVTE